MPNKKSKTSEYQVKYQIKAIVGLNIKASSLEEALELAKSKMNTIKVFNSELDHITGTQELAGHDNMDLWDETDS